MKPRQAILAVAMAFLLLPACGGGSELEGDTSVDTAADSPPDTTADTAPDTAPDVPIDTAVDGDDPDVPLPTAITFEIAFITDIPGYEYLFVQSGDYNGMVAWISVLDLAAIEIPLQPRCDICTCAECTGCGVCGIADPWTTMVSGGSSTSWTWDGVTHYASSCGGGPAYECQEEGPLAPGTYTARFCWGLGTIDAYPDDVIETPSCADVLFEYPVPGGRVEYLVNNGG